MNAKYIEEDLWRVGIRVRPDEGGVVRGLEAQRPRRSEGAPSPRAGGGRTTRRRQRGEPISSSSPVFSGTPCRASVTGVRSRGEATNTPLVLGRARATPREPGAACSVLLDEEGRAPAPPAGIMADGDGHKANDELHVFLALLRAHGTR
jgi:hypothetical protein